MLLEARKITVVVNKKVVSQSCTKFYIGMYFNCSAVTGLQALGLALSISRVNVCLWVLVRA